MKYETRKKGRKREVQINGMEDEDEVIRTEAVLISESLPTHRH